MEGLCNGTRLICRELRHNTICAEIAVGQYRGKRVFLPKIPLQTSDSEKNGILFKRTQFPVKLCFAMMINKSQRQTLDYVGIYLREPVFSHSQLYVALSHAKSSSAIKALIVSATCRDVVTECKTRNVVFHEVLELARQMVNLLSIANIKPKMRGWLAHVTVQEKMHITSSQKSPTRYQKFVFSDDQGSRVEGIMFNAAIEKMGSKLHTFKKYLISNADVREIEEQYQTNDLTIQWVISAKTVVEELSEQGSCVLTNEFTPISFKDLASYADSKSQTVGQMVPTVLSLWNTFVENEGKLLADHHSKHPVLICRRLKVVTYNGIALSTRNDSVIVVDPPVRDARSLKNWASRNEKELLALRRDKPYNNQSPKIFYGPRQKLTEIRDVLPTEKVSWVKCMFSFEHILQKYWYMAYVKCRRLTSADYGCTYTCNHCNEKQSAQPRCRFDIDLTDHSDTITASIFGEQAETLLGFTASQAMHYFNRLKPGSTKNDGSYQRYTIVYYFEENAETTSAENQLHRDSNASADKEELPSKTSRSLLSSLDESEEATPKRQRNK
ncbi:replication protein A 70 kDa DNA-binding subunit B-like [Coffea eugenioides]|uniref:replication protein A 70 kDa DNA-binding subunit B-like n=1 Tax=Coffea eugenioides TaxID=49369 RepID=UPI000F60FC62|nr:replication protein A 70 kDa DNA-binding subunit B-like [Coffea eugenioides]